MNVAECGPAGAVLRAWRSRPGSRVRTQRQHAGHLGYQPSHLSRIETGRRVLTDTEARRLLEPLVRDEQDERRAIAAYLYASGWLDTDQFKSLWSAEGGEPICACRRSETFLQPLGRCRTCAEPASCDGSGDHGCACDPETVRW